MPKIPYLHGARPANTLSQCSAREYFEGAFFLFWKRKQSKITPTSYIGYILNFIEMILSNISAT